MKNIFFVLFVCVCIFPVVGMDAEELPFHAAALGTPIRQGPVLNLHIYVPPLSNLLAMSIEQIENIHKIFSGEFTKEDQPRVQIAQIKALFDSLLENVFVPYFKTPRNKRFTPDYKRSLGTHLKDIASDSPGTFTKKGSADFLKSTDPDEFYTFNTHEQNTFFIQKMLIDPASGFSLFRSYTNTLDGPSYGKYNVVKLLDAGNPETRSGPVELHHVYQNPEVITIVPYSEHKGRPKAYHKLSKDSKIDRASCASEFYFIKKLIGLLQVTQMCMKVLYDYPDLTDSIVENLRYMENYEGNICILPNPNAALEIKQKYTVQQAFTRQKQRDQDEINEDVDRSDSWSGSTASADNSRLSYAKSSDESDEEDVFLPKVRDVRDKRRGSVSTATTSPDESDEDVEEDEQLSKRKDTKQTPERFKVREEDDKDEDGDDFSARFMEVYKSKK